MVCMFNKTNKTAQNTSKIMIGDPRLSLENLYSLVFTEKTA